LEAGKTASKGVYVVCTSCSNDKIAHRGKV
jgi:hypothetical protein